MSSVGMTGGSHPGRQISYLLLLLFLLLHLLLVVPGSESRHHRAHHFHEHRQHTESDYRQHTQRPHRTHRHRSAPTKQPPDPILSCNANLTATVSTNKFDQVLVAGASPGDPQCRSQRNIRSINFNLKTDCGVQRSDDFKFNFTIVARRFWAIASDEDRIIRMKCTIHLSGAAHGTFNTAAERGSITIHTGAARGRFRVADDPNVDTVVNGMIIHEREDDEDIVLVDPVDDDAERLSDVIQKSSSGNSNVQIHRDVNSIEALHSNMVASERRQEEEAKRLLTEDVLPDGRIVFRPQKFWYLAPLLAAVVFVSIFILVVYVRQRERSRKLHRLSTKKQLATARTPTLEDIRAIVGSEETTDECQIATSAESGSQIVTSAESESNDVVDAHQMTTSAESPSNDVVDAAQVTPDFDFK